MDQVIDAGNEATNAEDGVVGIVMNEDTHISRGSS
jgi:hypothetical protein